MLSEVRGHSYMLFPFLNPSKYEIDNIASSIHLKSLSLGLSFYQKFTGKSVKIFYRFTGKMVSVNFGKYQIHSRT